MTFFKAGDMVEGYRVIAELGRGAASVIYVVQDLKTKQVWALKHVERDPDAKDGRFLDQAESEYKVANALRHPGLRHISRCIKKTHRLLTVKELFLVMELVDGVPLDQQQPDRIDVAVHIFQQVADALAFMHSQGWVHADMKPNNIVISDGEDVKVIDLGQSCRVGTVKPRIQGTPDYIAPEQVHRHPITDKTDVYNLGATMYWVLTKRHIPTALPKGDNLVNSLDAHLIEKPVPPAEINPKVPPKLNDLIMQCVEANADKRPPDMKTVADRLNLILGMLRVEHDRKSGSGMFNPLESTED